ncbi:MAG: ABC transporter ATP-binding protein/permease [Spirochaetes bacterium]|nr:ABC transporter ATP-binding protein/permease [Spirochaetota bacterium]
MLKEYRTILPYAKHFFWWYIAGLFFVILADLGQLIIPQLLKRIIDSIQFGDFEMQQIIIWCSLIIITAVGIAITRFGWRFFIHGASRRIESKLRERYFDHLLNLTSSFYGKNKTGDLMARATNDMRAIRMATGMGLVAFVDGTVLAGAVLIVLFSENSTVAIFSILPLPFLTLFILFFGRSLGRLFKDVQEGFSRISEQGQEALTGTRVIKSFVKENYFLNKFMEASDFYRQKNMQLVRIWGFFFPLIAFVAGFSTLILLFIGGNAVLQMNLTTGEFVAIMSYLGMLIWPMIGVGFTINIIQRGAASLKRINEVLDTAPDISNQANALASLPVGDIKVKDLSYCYPESQTEVLSNISFTLKKGQILGVLGKTGSGKTTLVKLFSRLLDPPPGTITIGGQDIQEFQLTSLRKAFGFVPQETFLFSKTIKENILFGTDDAPLEEILKVADLSTISTDIQNFPKGMETLVGEKGTTLSGGQKQRLAISRALLIDPEILVFDDALSAVDTETEAKIIDHILKNRKEKTTMIISHRISALKEADLIMVLDKGRIVQQGTHDSLLKKPGFYAEIYELQNW